MQCYQMCARDANVWQIKHSVHNNFVIDNECKNRCVGHFRLVEYQQRKKSIRFLFAETTPYSLIAGGAF